MTPGGDMSLSPRCRFAALVLGAGLALLLPSAATATTPLITDPAGDANPAAYACQAPAIDPCPTSVSQLSEPAIDILEGDIAQDGTDLLFRIKLDDIDGAPLFYDTDREFHSQTQYLGLTITLGVNDVGRHDTTATGSFNVVDIASSGGDASVDVTLDATTQVLEWRVPLTVANDVLEAVCATCSAIGPGSTFQGFHVAAAYQTDPTGFAGMSCLGRCDRGRSSGSYTLS